MFDNLRDQTNSTPFYEEEAKFQSAVETTTDTPSRRLGRLLGMTAPQRFLVSVLLLVMTCAMGTLLLIAFNKVGI